MALITRILWTGNGGFLFVWRAGLSRGLISATINFAKPALTAIKSLEIIEFASDQ